MSHVKTSFVPDAEQSGAGARPAAKTSLLEIIMKLAQVNGFNNEYQIRDRSGAYVAGTDARALVSYAVQPEKLIRGKQQFAELLSQAGVAPSMVANENLRKHMNIGFTPPSTPPPQPPPTPKPVPRPPSSTGDTTIIDSSVSSVDPVVIANPIPQPPPLSVGTEMRIRKAKPKPATKRVPPISGGNDSDEEVDPFASQGLDIKGGKRRKTADANQEHPKRFAYESYHDDDSLE